MTSDEAAKLLGPEVTARVREEARQDGPLSEEQLTILTAAFLPYITRLSPEEHPNR